jgi:hypothetical protein
MPSTTVSTSATTRDMIVVGEPNVIYKLAEHVEGSTRYTVTAHPPTPRKPSK